MFGVSDLGVQGLSQGLGGRGIGGARLSGGRQTERGVHDQGDETVPEMPCSHRQVRRV